MLENFHRYFEAIELPKPMIERAEQLCGVFDSFIEKPVQDVFIGDFFEAEGARRYASLWLKTPTYLIEAKNFVVLQQIDFTPLADAEYLDVARSDLVPLDQTGPKSTMRVEVRFRFSLHAVLMAAHNNCAYLQAFTAKHLMPRGALPAQL